MTPFTLQVPASAGGTAGVATLHQGGKYFLLTKLTGAFSVVTSNQERYDFSETGSGFGDDASKTFGALTFYNFTAGAISITFYVSFSPIKTPDVNVTSSVSVTATLTSAVADCAPANLNYTQVQGTVINTAYKFSAFSTPTRKITVVANKNVGGQGVVPTANTGKVYISPGGNGAFGIVLNNGDIWTFEAATGASYNLDQFYFWCDTAGDGLTVYYDT